MDRRQFLATSSSCSAHMLGMALFAPAMFALGFSLPISSTLRERLPTQLQRVQD